MPEVISSRLSIFMCSLLILEHQTGDHAPMDIVACGSVDREYEGDPKARLYPADRFQVCPKAHVREKIAMSMVWMINRRLSRQLKYRDQLLQTMQRQLVVLKRVAKNETVLERLQSTIHTPANQSGIADDGLEGKIIAELQVIENFRNDLGVLADRR